MKLIRSKNRLDVYTESTRNKNFVGSLIRKPNKKYYFEYSRDYLKSRGAIQIGPELPLTKIAHETTGAKLFPSFEDRIPSKSNPAYIEYCELCGISADEKNRVILLTTIGRRGPSSFVFEPYYETGEGNVREALIKFRKELNISLRTMAEAFNLSYLTLQKIEKGVSKDRNILRLLYLYLNFPEIAIWSLTLNSAKLPSSVVSSMMNYFKGMERG